VQGGIWVRLVDLGIAQKFQNQNVCVFAYFCSIKILATMTTTTIREEVRKLARTEQLSLIQYIVEILQEDDDFVLSEAWKEELDKRDEDYRAGTEKLHTWAEAQKMIAPQS